MSHVFARTGDPLFFVVPQKSLLAGFGDAPEPIGTRTTGLVLNYLPWFLTTLHEHGDPQPESLLKVQSQPEEITVGKGGAVQVRFTLRNTGPTAVEDLKTSFHSRLDFQVTLVGTAGQASSGTYVLPPGGVLELRYAIRAPERINLTCQYNGTAYGHLSALYRREGKSHFAHAWVKIGME
jgi:hypothetical protein